MNLGLANKTADVLRSSGFWGSNGLPVRDRIYGLADYGIGNSGSQQGFTIFHPFLETCCHTKSITAVIPLPTQLQVILQAETIIGPDLGDTAKVLKPMIP